MMDPPVVQVEVFEVGSATNRPVRGRGSATESLESRKDEIEAAIALAVELSKSAMVAGEDATLKVSEIVATIGIVLKAEAGVVLTKAGAEASLEFTIKVSR